MVDRYRVLILFGYSVFVLGLITWMLGLTTLGQKHIDNPTSEFSVITTGAAVVALHILILHKQKD